MELTAKLFANGRSQAVRLPSIYRFEGQEVFIRRDAATGDVILSRRPGDWGGFLVAAEKVQVPEDFLSLDERTKQGHQDISDLPDRDPFEPMPTTLGH